MMEDMQEVIRKTVRAGKRVDGKPIKLLTVPLGSSIEIGDEVLITKSKKDVK